MMDPTVTVWDLATGTPVCTMAGHFRMVSSVAMTGDGSRVASGGASDNLVKVWNVESGACVSTLEGHTGGVTSVAMSEDGTRVVCGSDVWAG